MKKILFLADGKSIHTQKLQKGLSSLGHEVSVISLDHQLGGFQSIQNLWSVRLKALAYIKKNKPDFIHAHYASSYGLLALSLNHPYLLSVWGSDIFDFPLKSPLHKWITKRILEGAQALFSTSKAMIDEMKVQSLTSKAIHQIPFGVDVNLFRPHRPWAPFEGDKIKIGLAKGMDPIYGIDRLIKVFSTLVREKEMDRPLELHLVGAGGYLEEYQKWVRDLRVEKAVIFHGKIDNSKVAEFYQSLDVAIFPSRRESFGVSALEAMACGCTTLVSHVGGLPEVIDYGKYGVIFKSDEELKIALKKVIADKLTFDAYPYVCKHFSEDIMIHSYADFYEKGPETL